MYRLTVIEQEIADDNGQKVLLAQVNLEGQFIHCHIPVAAVENRRKLYGLKTDEEALEAIFKEVATRNLGRGRVAVIPLEPEALPADNLELLEQLERAKTVLAPEIFERLLGREHSRITSERDAYSAEHKRLVVNAEKAARMGGLRQDVIIQMATEEDLPPVDDTLRPARRRRAPHGAPTPHGR